MITPENIDEIEERVYRERNRLMDEKGLKWRQAFLTASAAVAAELGMETEAFRQQLRAVRKQVLWSLLSRDFNHRALARRAAWQADPQRFEAVLKVLFEHDPIGICDHDGGAAEYAAEVNTILPRLPAATSAQDVQQIVYEEFERWFGPSRHPPELFAAIAADLWRLLAMR